MKVSDFDKDSPGSLYPLAGDMNHLKYREVDDRVSCLRRLFLCTLEVLAILEQFTLPCQEV